MSGWRRNTSAQPHLLRLLKQVAHLVPLRSTDEAGPQQSLQSLSEQFTKSSMFVLSSSISVSWVGAQHLSFRHSLPVCSVVFLRSHQSSSRHLEQNVAFVSAIMRDFFSFFYPFVLIWERHSITDEGCHAVKILEHNWFCDFFSILPYPISAFRSEIKCIALH